MISKIAISSIKFYQVYISPHKGYCCAYSHYTGKKTCSEFTKECIKKYGVVKSYFLHKKHIEKCQIVYFSEIKKKKEVDMCNELAGVCACL